MRFLAAMAVAASGLWACDKPAPEPTPGPDPGPGPEPETLVDQLMYDGGDAVDIKSVIWQQSEDKTYTFWFSPEANITTVEDMEAADGVLAVKVTKAEGTVDNKTELLDLQYEDIHIMPQTLSDAKKCVLSIDLTADDHVSLSLDVEMASGKTLAAEYDNTCLKVESEPVVQPLDNQFELDGVVSDIKSVVASYTVSNNTTDWLFYTQEGIVSPTDGAALKVGVTGAPASLKIDLSLTGSVTVSCGDFSNSETTAGTVTFTVEGSNVTMSLDGTEGQSRLRAEYSGAFTSVADSPESHIKVVDAGGTTVVDAALTAVFRQADASNVRLVLGDASNPSSPEDLMGGKYVLDLRIPSMFVTEDGRELDYNDISGLAYDYYQEYSTWAVEDAESCSVYLRKTGDNALYMTFSVKLADGPLFEGTWYGEVTDVTEFPDLTPVEPTKSAIYFTPSENMEVSEYDKEKPLVGMIVRKESGLKLNGGASNESYGGATFDAYVFYFLTEDSNSSNVDDDSPYGELLYTPRLTVPVSIVTGEEVSLADPPQKWQFRYNSSYLYKGIGGYGHDYSNQYSSTYNCPDDAVLTASFDSATKVWKIRFSMTDMISKAPYGNGYGTGMVIEWEGMATKYTGSKPNEIPDSDYIQ